MGEAPTALPIVSTSVFPSRTPLSQAQAARLHTAGRFALAKSSSVSSVALTETRTSSDPAVLAAHLALPSRSRAPGPPDTRRGWLDAQYDETGNLSAMVVRRTATMTPSGSSGWQRFAYAWDEVGRLMSASRWDLASSRDYAVEHDVSSRLENPPPSRTPTSGRSFRSATFRCEGAPPHHAQRSSHSLYIRAS